MLGIEHVVDPVNVDESIAAGEGPSSYAVRLACEKAVAGSARHPGKWVLGSDTVVVIDGEILGKPKSTAEAQAMLARLAGRRHTVITAIALCNDGTVFDARDETSVWIKALDSESIEKYVETGEPMDKAGSYGIQGFGSVLVERIEGDYFSVMGLPVRLVVDLMAKAEIPYSFTS